MRTFTLKSLEVVSIGINSKNPSVYTLCDRLSVLCCMYMYAYENFMTTKRRDTIRIKKAKEISEINLYLHRTKIGY